MEARVTGIGGVFFKARDADSLRAWYARHLKLAIADWGGTSFRSPAARGDGRSVETVWSIFSASSDYFAPSAAPFMINYRVSDLEAVLESLRAEGCDVDPKTETSQFGKFGWVMDPEGNRIELWEPPPGGVAE